MRMLRPMVLAAVVVSASAVVWGQAAAPRPQASAPAMSSPGTGLLAACVPGTFESWMLLLRDYGTMRLRDVLEPAIGYAANGYPLVERAAATIQIVERYYLAIALLLHAGSAALTPEALEQSCVTTAQRMAMLYELNSPEFFDRALFGNFVGRLRARNVVSEAAEDKLVFDAKVLEAVASDAQFVLHEQIRNSILQVVHR